jgi:hypothetical protein
MSIISGSGSGSAAVRVLSGVIKKKKSRAAVSDATQGHGSPWDINISMDTFKVIVITSVAFRVSDNTNPTK